LKAFEQEFPKFLNACYADDSNVLIPLKSLTNAESIIQPVVDFIDNWVSSAGLDFSDGKSKAVIFRYGHNRLPSLPSIFLRGKEIGFCDTVKVLGITFSGDMKFSEHISDVVRKSNCMLGALRRKLGRRAPPSVIGTLYDSCIRSVLEYGCVVWDPILENDISDLERSQKFAVRLYLNDFTLNYDAALQKAGWSSLSDRRKRLKLCQFYKFYRGLHPFDFYDFTFRLKSDLRCSSRTCDPHHLVVPRHFYDAFKQSFMFSCLFLWNQLPYEVALLNLNAFRTALNNTSF
jgi:hypothetical protein